MVSPIAQINANRRAAGFSYQLPRNMQRPLAPVVPIRRPVVQQGATFADKLAAAAPQILTNPAFDAPQQGGGGVKDQAIHGLGWLIGNPVSKAVLKPLEMLQYPMAGVVGSIRQGLDTELMQDLNRTLAKLPGVDYSPLNLAEGDTPGWDWGELWQDIKSKEGGGTSIVEPIMGEEGTDRNIWLRRGAGFALDVAADPLMKLGTGTKAASGTEARINYLNKLLDAQDAAKIESAAAREAADTAELWARLGGTGADEAAQATAAAAERYAQRVQDLTQIGDQDALNLIGRRGVNIATPAQLEAMGAPRHAIRWADVPVEDLARRFMGETVARGVGRGSEATSRAMSRFLSPGKELWTRTAGGQLRKIATPKGLRGQTLRPATERILRGEGAMAQDVALRTHNVNQTMRLAAGEFRTPAVSYLHQFADELKPFSRDEQAALVKAAEETGVENATTALAPQIIETMKAMGLDPPELKPWTLPNGAQSRYVMPHVLSRDAFRFFNRLKKGQNPLVDFIRRDLGITDRDLLEEGGFLQRRFFRPNADGSPQTFKIGKDEVEIVTGSVSELEDKLGGLLRRHGFEGKLYESNPVEAWRRYIKSVEKDVAKNVALEKATEYGLEGLERKLALPKSWDPFGRDIRMQPAEGETEPRYVRGPTTEQRPASTNQYEWVEDVEATKARNEIITGGGKKNVHQQVLREFEDIATPQRENIARGIENTRQYTEAAFEKARAQSGKRLTRAEAVVTSARARVDKLEAEYLELLKESSANEELIRAAQSTIHGVRSQTPKNIKAAIERRLAEIGAELEHERGRWESLQRGLQNALDNDRQDQIDEALERFATLHENLSKAEAEMKSMRGKATRAVERRLKRESKGKAHLIGPVEQRRAAEVVGNQEAADRAQSLLTRKENLTAARAEAEAEAKRLITEAERLENRADNLGQRGGRSAAQEQRIANSQAEMRGQARDLRREANAQKARANGYAMNLRDTERRIAEDPWLQAKEIVDQYDVQQARIADYAATHGIDMKAAQSRLNEAQRKMREYELETMPPPQRPEGQYLAEQLARPDLAEHQQKIERLNELNQELNALGPLDQLVGENPPTKLEWQQTRGEGGRLTGEYTASTQPEQWGRAFHLRDPETGELIWTGDYDPRGRGKPIRYEKGGPIRGYTRDNAPFTGFRITRDEQGWRLTLPGEAEPIDRVFRTNNLAREAANARWPALRRQTIRTGEDAELRRSYVETLRQERDQLAEYAKANTNKDDQIERITRPAPVSTEVTEEQVAQARAVFDEPDARLHISDETIRNDLQRQIDEMTNPTAERRQPAKWIPVGSQGSQYREPRALRTWRSKNAQRRRLLGEMERVQRSAYNEPTISEKALRTESTRAVKPRPKEGPKWFEEYRAKPTRKRVPGNEPWWMEEYPTQRPDLSMSKRSRTIRLKKLQTELDKVEKWLADHPQPPRPAFPARTRKLRANVNGRKIVLERTSGVGANAPAEWLITSRGAEERFQGTLLQAMERAERFGIESVEPDPAELAALQQRLAQVNERLAASTQGQAITEARQTLSRARAQAFPGEARFGEAEYPPLPQPTREELVRQPYEEAISRVERRLGEVGAKGTPAELEGIRTGIQGAADERIAGLQGEVGGLQFQQERIHSMIENLYQNRLPDPVNDWQQALNNAAEARAIHEQINEYIKQYAVRERAMSIVEKNARKGAPTAEDLKRVAKREMRPEDAQGLMAAVDDINDWMTNAGQVLPVGTRKRIEAMLMSHEQALAALTRDTDLTAHEMERMVKAANNGTLPKVLKAQYRQGWREVGQDGGILIDENLERAMFGVEEVLDSKLFGPLFTTWTNFFKTYATLTPGFHVRNAISAIFMNATEGVGARQQMRAIKLWREYKAAKNPVEWLAGRSKQEQDAFRATFASGAGGQFLEGGVGEARAGASRMTERLFANPATRLSKRFGEWVEGPQRLALGLHTTQAGGTAAEALSRISRIHFDYAQVSKFDETMKRLIPFWTFMSRNVPLQFTQMWLKPKAYLGFQSFARNLQMGTEDSPVIPSYITQGGGLYFGAKTPKWAEKIPIIGPPAGMPLVLQPDLPQNRYFDDLQRLQNAASGHGLGQVATNLNPMITTPAEFVSRTDFFTGQRFDETDRVKVGGASLPYAAALSLVGLAERGPDGNWYVDAAALNAMRSLDPNLDKAMRLLPQLTGLEDTDRTGASTTARQAESWARYIGAPIRTISEQQQRSELRSRAFEERDRRRLQAAMGG